MILTIIIIYLSAACASSAAKGVASRKEIKYAARDHWYTFIPLAFETYGPINNKGIKFLQELGCRLRTISDDPRESAFLLQRISVTLQRLNAIAFLLFWYFHPGLWDRVWGLTTPNVVLTLVVNSRDFYYRGYTKIIIITIIIIIILIPRNYNFYRSALFKRNKPQTTSLIFKPSAVC